MKRKAKPRSRVKPLPRRVLNSAPIEGAARVPPQNQWVENPDLAFGIRIRANMAIPAVWPM